MFFRNEDENEIEECSWREAQGYDSEKTALIPLRQWARQNKLTMAEARNRLDASGCSISTVLVARTMEVVDRTYAVEDDVLAREAPQGASSRSLQRSTP